MRWRTSSPRIRSICRACGVRTAARSRATTAADLAGNQRRGCLHQVQIYRRVCSGPEDPQAPGAWVVTRRGPGSWCVGKWANCCRARCSSSHTPTRHINSIHYLAGDFARTAHAGPAGYRKLSTTDGVLRGEAVGRPPCFTTPGATNAPRTGLGGNDGFRQDVLSTGISRVNTPKPVSPLTCWSQWSWPPS